jgi:hypothetical protein
VQSRQKGLEIRCSIRLSYAPSRRSLVPSVLTRVGQSSVRTYWPTRPDRAGIRQARLPPVIFCAMGFYSMEAAVGNAFVDVLAGIVSCKSFRHCANRATSSLANFAIRGYESPSASTRVLIDDVWSGRASVKPRMRGIRRFGDKVGCLRRPFQCNRSGTRPEEEMTSCQTHTCRGRTPS